MRADSQQIQGMMPYDTVHALPDTIRKVLPEYGQELFKSAFNDAWSQYQDIEELHRGESREEFANMMAWAAVREKFEKSGEQWREKKQFNE